MKRLHLFFPQQLVEWKEQKALMVMQAELLRSLQHLRAQMALRAAAAAVLPASSKLGRQTLGAAGEANCDPEPVRTSAEGRQLFAQATAFCPEEALINRDCFPGWTMTPGSIEHPTKA